MRIPLDVSSVKAKMKGAFNGVKPPVQQQGAPAPTRRTMSEIAKEREKRKALTDELADAKTSDARKAEIIAGLQAQLETTQAELEEHKAKVEDLTPKAKAWSAYEHKERAKLIDKFPPEKRKAVQKIADSLDLADFKEYAESLVGASTPVAGKQGNGASGGAKDWDAILQGADAEKEIAADPAGFNAFMDSQGKA